MKKIAMFVAMCACALPDEDLSSAEASSTDPIASDDLDVKDDGAPQAIGTFFTPAVAEQNDMCCPTGSWTNCVADTADSCAAGKTLTACYGCDDDGDPSCTPKSFTDNPWVWMGPVPGNTYFCSGLAFKRGTNGGQYVYNTCAQDGCFTNYGDGGVCTTDIGTASPNPCDPIPAAALYSFEGMMTRMCCESDGGGPPSHLCTPRSSDQSCAGMPDGHTIAAYCMPCFAIGGTYYDPDGSPGANTNGTWDLLGIGNNEWPGSINCAQFSEPDLPNWTGDVCNITEYVCRGKLVRADGIVIQDAC